MSNAVDHISDMLIRIKNAQKAHQESMQISYSKFKHEIAKALERSGYIGKIERRGKRIKKILEMELHKEGVEGTKTVQEVKLISTPSRRIYAGHKDIQHGGRGGGTLLVSTSKGVMTGVEAKKKRLGGQLIAKIW